jgi:hypothetical protein
MTTETQKNLEILSTHLKKVSAVKFDMTFFIQNIEQTEDYLSRFRAAVDTTIITIGAPDYNACGTVCCAAGHGPNAGIDPLPGENWGTYIDRCFAAPADSPLFDWLFDGGWADVDNTPEGAAARIDYFLEHGIPADFEGVRRLESAQAYNPGAIPSNEEGTIDYKELYPIAKPVC